MIPVRELYADLPFETGKYANSLDEIRFVLAWIAHRQRPASESAQRMKRTWPILLLLFASLNAAAQYGWNRKGELSTDMNSHAEFAFTRIIFKSGYSTLPGPGNTSWRDWPEADAHFIRGVQRLTAVNIEDNSRAILLTDEQLFDRPWIYALEVGTWLLTRAEADNLRDYLLRGGFLVVDDFHGRVQWEGFMRSMRKVFPDRPIVEVGADENIMSMHFDVDMTKPIPGIMALRYGVTFEHDGYVPTRRGIYDDDGRLMVIINFNVDLGDAWEMADDPRYPEKYTALAYRFGINYVLYAMTH